MKLTDRQVGPLRRRPAPGRRGGGRRRARARPAPGPPGAGRPPPRRPAPRRPGVPGGAVRARGGRLRPRRDEVAARRHRRGRAGRRGRGLPRVALRLRRPRPRGPPPRRPRGGPRRAGRVAGRRPARVTRTRAGCGGRGAGSSPLTTPCAPLPPVSNRDRATGFGITRRRPVRRAPSPRHPRRARGDPGGPTAPPPVPGSRIESGMTGGDAQATCDTSVSPTPPKPGSTPPLERDTAQRGRGGHPERPLTVASGCTTLGAPPPPPPHAPPAARRLPPRWSRRPRRVRHRRDAGRVRRDGHRGRLRGAVRARLVPPGPDRPEHVPDRHPARPPPRRPRTGDVPRRRPPSRSRDRRGGFIRRVGRVRAAGHVGPRPVPRHVGRGGDRERRRRPRDRPVLVRRRGRPRTRRAPSRSGAGSRPPGRADCTDPAPPGRRAGRSTRRRVRRGPARRPRRGGPSRPPGASSPSRSRGR